MRWFYGTVCFLLVCFISLSAPFYVCYAALVFTPSDASASDAFRLGAPEPLYDGSQTPDAVYALSDAPVGYAVSAGDFVNCVCYDVTISGIRYILLLPTAYESLVMVDSDGYLWNMSASSISGRLFTGSFNPAADTGIILTLAPCLGNNFSTNHNYGSPNYMRRYYWSSSDRLSYTDTYCLVQVDRAYHLFKSGDLLTYVIIFLLGCMLIKLWQRSAR